MWKLVSITCTAATLAGCLTDLDPADPEVTTVSAAASTPTITGFLPDRGPWGASVTIGGFDFAGLIPGLVNVCFGDNPNPASYIVVSTNEIRAGVPNGSLRGKIRLQRFNCFGGAFRSAFTINESKYEFMVLDPALAAPVNVVATVLGDNGMKLSWVPTPGAAGYIVWVRDMQTAVGWITYKVPIAGATSTIYTFKLPDGNPFSSLTKYRFRLTAFTSRGESNFSNESTTLQLARPTIIRGATTMVDTATFGLWDMNGDLIVNGEAGTNTGNFNVVAEFPMFNNPDLNVPEVIHGERGTRYAHRGGSAGNANVIAYSIMNVPGGVLQFVAFHMFVDANNVVTPVLLSTGDFSGSAILRDTAPVLQSVTVTPGNATTPNIITARVTGNPADPQFQAVTTMDYAFSIALDNTR